MQIQTTFARAFDITDGFAGMIIMPNDPVTGQPMPGPIVTRFSPSANLGDFDIASLMLARRDGYSTTVDQLDYGITALAVPIRSANGTTIAALNTSGYSGLVTPEQLIQERLPELRATASQIARQIARHPALQSALLT